MVNEEILGGLKSSVARGESLLKAMISFYNAGYKKDEIEEAAHALKSAPPAAILSPQVPQPIRPQIQQPVQPRLVQAAPIIQQPMAVQRVSAYAQKPEIKGRGLTITLIIILFLLLSSLIAVFIFKDALIGLFNKIL